MRAIALGLLLCAAAFTSAGASPPVKIDNWKTAAGKAPTITEFAAVVAACEQKAVAGAQDKTLDACLGDLGLRRVE